MNLTDTDRLLIREHIKALREFNRNVAEQKKELWVSAGEVMKLTGWNYTRLRDERIKGHVIARKLPGERKVYQYNLNSIDNKFLNNLKVA